MVVLFNDSGTVISSLNYSSASKLASDGSTVAVSKASSGASRTGSLHAGPAFGGTAGANSVSAVWDGVSTSDPAYQAAVLGTLDAYAQATATSSIGSPGYVPGVFGV